MTNQSGSTTLCSTIACLALTLSAHLAISAPIILEDHRAVGIEGFVYGIGSGFMSVNERAGLTVPGAIGDFTRKVMGSSEFMNSHATQVSSVRSIGRISAAGEAQAQFRNDLGNQVSEFSSGTEFQVTFQIVDAEDGPFNLSGDIRLTKGLWSLGNPMTARLDVSVVLAKRIGGATGTLAPLFGIELTDQNLLNPDCLPGAPVCNTFYLPEFRRHFDFSGIFEPGFYTLLASARADSILGRMEAQTFIDGTALFDVKLRVPEPPALPLTAAVVVLAALTGRHARTSRCARGVLHE